MARLNPTLIRHRAGRPLIYGLLALLVLARYGAPTGATGPNGFDLDGALVPIDEIHHGGPPRDGIPALDQPAFLPADDAHYLEPEDRVLGLEIAGLVRAYPVKILNYHEIVNDRSGEDRLVVSYCPLCGTGMAFRHAGPEGFGVSGLLYNSDLLLYDRETESLWSQIMGRAVAGPRRGERLQPVPVDHTSWEDWRARHPRTQVLSEQTGHRRDYDLDPYPGYSTSKDLYFPVSRLDRRYHPKEPVLGLRIGGDTRVYPFSELSLVTTPLRDRVGGVPVEIYFDERNGRARALAAGGEPLPATAGYWFAWITFYPESRVFRADDERPGGSGAQPR